MLIIGHMQESAESLAYEYENPYGSHELVLARFAEDISWQAPGQIPENTYNTTSCS